MPQGKGNAGPRTELSRDLGVFSVTMIGVGAMIGAGIFVLTGLAAGAAGPALILAFCLNGVVTVLTAMVYAELGSAIPEAGGGYLWIKDGLPGGNAFMAGWMSWFAHAVAGSLYALGFGSYATLTLETLHGAPGGLAGTLLERGLAVVVVLIFVYINYRGASETGLAGALVTVAKLVILGLFIVSGLVHIVEHPDFMGKFTPFAPNGMGGVFVAMGLTFIAFEGYEIIVQAGEEVRQPRKNVPRAVFWSLAIVIPIYVLVAFVAVGAVDAGGQPTWQWLGKGAERSLVHAATQFMPLGTALMLFAGFMATMSALNATTFSSTRVAFAMGRDNSFPDAFAKIHRRRRTPVVALCASGALMLTMVLLVPIRDVAAATDIMFLLLFLQVNVAVITIRKKYGGKMHYGYLVPFFPAVPILAIVCMLGVALFMFRYSPLAWYVAIGWLAAGGLLYRFYAKPHQQRAESTPVLVSSGLPSREKRYRVLISVSNPQNVDGLVHFAAHIARANQGEVIVQHTLVIPAQLPPSAASSLKAEGTEAIDRATELLEERDVPSFSLMRVSHLRLWRSIVDTIREKEVDFLVMGWSASRRRRRELARDLVRILHSANCNVAVIRNAPTEPVRRVLVAAATPEEGQVMLRAAWVLADRSEGNVDIVHVADPQEQEEGREVVDELQQMANAAKVADPFGPHVSVSLVSSAHHVHEIVERAKDCDLLVMGPSHEAWFRRRLIGTAADRIAAAVDCPLMLVSPRQTAMGSTAGSFFEFFHDLEGKGEEEAEEAQASGAPAEGEEQRRAEAEAEAHKQREEEEGKQ